MLPSDMPRLQRSPVTLRAFKECDARLIEQASQDPLTPLITTVPTIPDPAEVQAYLKRQHERLTTGKGYSIAVADTDR